MPKQGGKSRKLELGTDDPTGNRVLNASTRDQVDEWIASIDEQGPDIIGVQGVLEDMIHAARAGELPPEVFREVMRRRQLKASIDRILAKREMGIGGRPNIL